MQRKREGERVRKILTHNYNYLREREREIEGGIETERGKKMSETDTHIYNIILSISLIFHASFLRDIH